MNKKILAVLAILMMLLPITAIAADQNNPQTYQVLIAVTEDTTFTVTLTPGLSPAETSLRFSGKPNTNDINATGQTSSRPWARVNNTGDYARNFTVGLNDTAPSGVTLRESNVPAMTGAITIGSTIQELVGGHLLPGGGTSSSLLNVYIKADYAASASIGTIYRTATFRNYMPIPGPRVIVVTPDEYPDTSGGPDERALALGQTDQYGNTIPISGATTWARAGGTGTAATLLSTTGTSVTARFTGVGTNNFTATNGGIVTYKWVNSS